MTKLKISKIHFKSMKLRIFCALLVFSLIPSLLMLHRLLDAFENREVEMLTIELTSQSKMLATQIAANGYLQNTEMENARMGNAGMGNTDMENINFLLEQLSNIYDGRVMIIDRAFDIIKDTYAMDEGRTIISEEVIRSFTGEEISHYDSRNQYLEMTFPIHDTSTQEVLGVILVSVSTDNIYASMERLREKADVFLICMTVIMFFMELLVAGNLVRPLRKMKKSLEKVAGGFEDEVYVYDYKETAEISEQFNAVFNSLKVLDQSRQEFVSNVSHELKTPITSMKVLADSLLGQENVPAELYKEFMVDIANEIDRETKIINDLLALVKMDKSASDMNIESKNINELLEQILKRLKPIAEQNNIELVLESFRPVSAEIDEVKLSLAITNLIENGIKYNRENGWVHVTLNADYQYFYLTVEDSGIGIPQEDQEHIYERFYRVDKSHSREIGGTGLGLAITRNSILMHRGAIKVRSELDKGTTFSVRIPLKYIA